MSARGTFRLDDVDKVTATLTITMTVGEWRDVRGSLTSQHPQWKVGNLIDDMVRAAERQFFGISDDGDQP